MIFLAASAAFVGLVHSMAPGHWLPVVLTVKGRRWPVGKAVAGAAVAASGHILISTILGGVSVLLGAHFIVGYEEQIERYGAIVLVAFGLIYATYAYFRHSSCHGHGHHGPSPSRQLGPFVFLFTLGLSPCVAVLPVFFEASAKGKAATLVTMASFSIGVLTALVASTLLVVRGVMKLDHPILEHYGDVITGLGVAAMGLVLFFVPI